MAFSYKLEMDILSPGRGWQSLAQQPRWGSPPKCGFLALLLLLQPAPNTVNTLCTIHHQNSQEQNDAERRAGRAPLCTA